MWHVSDLGRRSGSRRRWAQHLGAAVPSAVVVELIAPGQHDAAGVVGVGQLAARQDFPFQAGEERLGGGIVETLSG